MTQAKAYAALVGAIATALLGVFTADTAGGQVLTVVAVIATTVATYAVPNRPTGGARKKPADVGPEAGAVSLEQVVTIAGGVFLGGFFLWLLVEAVFGRL